MRALAAGAVALALALGAAACGGDDEGPTTPPTASVTPPDALFGDAVVRPEGDQQEAVDGALSKLLNTDDPGGFIVEQLDTALTEGDAGITYAEDIEPWLGEHVGLFFTSFAEQPDGAVVAEVTDQAAASEAIDKVEVKQGPSTDGSYKGVEYRVEDAGAAVGFVEDFLVAGTEAGFRDAVDASQGDSLADDDAFQGEIETAPDDALATGYADAPVLLDRLEEVGEITSDERAAAEDQAGAALEQPAIASLTAADDNIAIETAFGAGDSPEPEESPILRELPADAWAAFAANDFGDDLRRSFDQFLTTVPGYDQFNAQLQDLLGSGVEELTGWVGDVGGFASGTSIFGLGGALVLETTDETDSGNLLDSIESSLQGDRSLRVEPLSEGEGFSVSPAEAPIRIVVEQRDGRVVAGMEQSVQDVFEPSDTLGDSDTFGSATKALGSDYAAGLFLDFEPPLELLESTGAAEDDPDYEAAKPYLDHLDYLVTGERRVDDQDVTRVVLGLR